MVVGDDRRRPFAREVAERPAAQVPLVEIVERLVGVACRRRRARALVDLIAGEEQQVGILLLEAPGEVGVREPQRLARELVAGSPEPVPHLVHAGQRREAQLAAAGLGANHARVLGIRVAQPILSALRRVPLGNPEHRGVVRRCELLPTDFGPGAAALHLEPHLTAGLADTRHHHRRHLQHAARHGMERGDDRPQGLLGARAQHAPAELPVREPEPARVAPGRAAMTDEREVAEHVVVRNPFEHDLSEHFARRGHRFRRDLRERPPGGDAQVEQHIVEHRRTAGEFGAGFAPRFGRQVLPHEQDASTVDANQAAASRARRRLHQGGRARVEIARPRADEHGGERITRQRLVSGAADPDPRLQVAPQVLGAPGQKMQGPHRQLGSHAFGAAVHDLPVLQPVGPVVRTEPDGIRLTRPPGREPALRRGVSGDGKTGDDNGEALHARIERRFTAARNV